MNGIAQTVFVVDDTPEVVVAITRLLGIAGYRVRTFESAERFLEEHDSEAPGCLLLDICLPGLSGIDLQRQLISSQCVRPIIFITGTADIQTSVHAMKEGAIDFLTKPIDRESLFAAVKHAIRRDAEQRAERAIRGSIAKRIQALTIRERQVLELVIRGRLNKQIAWELSIAEKTVKVHRRHLMSKMAARSIADLVQLATRVGVAKGSAFCGGPAAVDLSIIRNPSATVQRSHPSRDSVQLSAPC